MKSNKQEKIEKTKQYIYQYSERTGFAPSIREICDGVGIKSTATAMIYINFLRDQGYLKKVNNKKRAIATPDNLSSRIPIYESAQEAFSLKEDSERKIVSYMKYSNVEENCIAICTPKNSITDLVGTLEESSLLIVKTEKLFPRSRDVFLFKKKELDEFIMSRIIFEKGELKCLVNEKADPGYDLSQFDPVAQVKCLICKY